MRRKSVMLGGCLFAALLQCAIAWAATYPGSGTPTEPYRISTAAQLNEIGITPSDMGACFVLISDIDLADLGPTPFNLIGTAANPFTGVFDGNGHTITNFEWSGSTDNAGLFSHVGTSGTIKSLGLKRANVTTAGGMYAGAVAGINYGTIEQCFATGRVEAFQGAGGLVGHNDGLISQSCSACTLYATDDAPGGLVGHNTGTIVNCYAHGSATTPGWWAGGLTALNDGTIIKCYSTTFVSSSLHPGGLVAEGIIPADANSFWDTQTSSQPASFGGTPLATPQMQTSAYFTAAGWDFEGETANGSADIWKMLREGRDYPRLAWQPEYPVDIAGQYGVNLEDFAKLAQWWLKTNCPTSDNCQGADLNTSGRVDTHDLQILASQWLTPY